MVSGFEEFWRRKIEPSGLLRPWLTRRYEKQFATNGLGSFRGVFDTFSQANESAPKTKPLGFDTVEYAREFQDRRNRVLAFDYPVLFWLRSILTTNATIFDFGGHTGTHFYAYQKYLQYPAGMKWTVLDLPEIIRAGRELARTGDPGGHLSFTGRFEDADGKDILIAAGSIQYVESPSFASALSTLDRKPRHLLINKLPLYEGRQFVTLQNGGVSFHPQYVFNRDEFIESLRALGYATIDVWTVDSHPCRIPFHPEQSFRSHTGMYLKRED